MKVTSRTQKFTINEDKAIIKDLKIIARKKHKTVADLIRDFNRRCIKANQDLLKD